MKPPKLQVLSPSRGARSEFGRRYEAGGSRPPNPWTRTAIGVLAASLGLALSLQAEVLERVIVKVNGDIVTQSEFSGRQVAAVQQARINPDQIPNFLRENNARILQEAIDDLLLVQRAEELGMRRPEALNRFVSEFIER